MANNRQQQQDWWSRWLPLLLTRGAGESATVSERIDHNVTTQVKIPVFKALALGFVAVPLVAIGFMGMVWRMAPLMGIRFEFGDTLLAGVLMASVIVLVVRILSSDLVNPYVRLAVALFMGFLTLAGAVMIMRNWDTADAIYLVLSIGAAIAGGHLFYLMSNEMINPYWPPSPMLLVLKDLLDYMKEDEEQPPSGPPEKEMVLVNAIGAQQQEQIGREYLGREQPLQPVIQAAEDRAMNSDFANLCWFVTLALHRGTLSRNHLTNKVQPTPRVPYPYKDQDGNDYYPELDRGIYADLLNEGVRRRLFRKMGQRRDPQFIASEEVTVGILVYQWGQMTEAPFPGYAPGLINQTPFEMAG